MLHNFIVSSKLITTPHFIFGANIFLLNYNGLINLNQPEVVMVQGRKKLLVTFYAFSKKILKKY
jgi:hypothetical protein